MSEDVEGFLPPSDWREQDDGILRVVEALLRTFDAGTDEDLEAFIPLAEELSAGGADFAAKSIAQTVALWLLGVEAKELKDSSEISNSDRFTEVLDRVRESDLSPSKLLMELCGVTADIYRWNGNWQAAEEWYVRATELASNLQYRFSEAVYLQSLGGVYAHVGAFERAEEVSERAIVEYERRRDIYRTVAVRLNQVQYALSAGRLDLGESRLSELSLLLAAVRDRHSLSSFRRLVAMLQIERGDLSGAREILLQEYRWTHRASDLRLEQIICQNIANLTRETHGSKAAIRWWRKALELAVQVRDHDQEQSVARALAIDLLEMEEFDESVELLEQSLRINRDRGNMFELARTQADLGAVQIEHGRALIAKLDSEQTGAQPDAPNLSQFSEAERNLTQAFEAFVGEPDEEWAVRVAHNLRLVWISNNHESAGVDILERAALGVRQTLPSLAATLLRSAADLGLGPGQDYERSVQQLRMAGEIERDSGLPNPWQMSRDAQTLAARHGEIDDVIELFDAALELAMEADDAALQGDILNDSALALAREHDFEGAAHRLHRADELAAAGENRVLGALVSLNLGEIALRQENPSQARTYLSRSAELSTAIGDLEQASEAYSSIVNSLLHDQESMDEAEVAAGLAYDLARDAGSPAALARANSSLASIAFDRGNFGEAFELWMESTHAVPAESRGIYQAFALDALASLGDWPRFSRTFDSFAKQSQRSRSQLEFSEHLWHAAGTWLRAGHERRAAKVLAYSVLLAAERSMSAIRAHALSDLRIPSDELLLRLAKVIGPTRTYLTWDGIEDASRLKLNRYFGAYIRARTSDEDADALLDLVMTLGLE